MWMFVVGSVYSILLGCSVMSMASLITELVEGDSFISGLAICSLYSVLLLITSFLIHIIVQRSTDGFLALRRVLGAVIYHKMLRLDHSSVEG